MSLALLTAHLSAETVKRLEAHGWPLVQRADVAPAIAEAAAQGWRGFLLAEEFLSVFDGFLTIADYEIYKEAWQAIPITAADYTPLRQLREERPIFPIGLGAGWAHLLLTDTGHIVCSLNGTPQLINPLHTHTIDSLIRDMITQREQDQKENNP
ncbi:SUKH-3 domain-containing protein [Deinococcus sp. SL84]|uniref:SUKH-3 domain-containing protein n=1 Tax=Deinococcus sp. SL84 TaxID=2994663 RepID=UPI00227476F6|nr:SUKH-3 domain-containing protein [Deinococcus sp. SL84]MCY1704121.1 SUKH-3 domain-containing protein [Deinococcus sp. SL84]